MINIDEIVIYSFDKGEESWEIEGEAYFDSDLSAVFTVMYLPEDDEFEEFEMDENAMGEDGEYDKDELKHRILVAAKEFEH